MAMVKKKKKEAEEKQQYTVSPENVDNVTVVDFFPTMFWP